MSPKHAEFIKYFRSFYGPGGLYAFDFEFSDRQVELAIALRGPNFEGDTLDREAIRDILLVANNQLGGAFEVKPTAPMPLVRDDRACRAANYLLQYAVEVGSSDSFHASLTDFLTDLMLYTTRRYGTDGPKVFKECLERARRHYAFEGGSK